MVESKKRQKPTPIGIDYTAAPKVISIKIKHNAQGVVELLTVHGWSSGVI
ncbi:hypothetical protein [Brucella intermedia]|nr:hypothetical protein [Brucella intermedia]